MNTPRSTRSRKLVSPSVTADRWAGGARYGCYGRERNQRGECRLTKVVLVDAVRTPIGKRGGALSNHHSIDLLAETLNALVDRTGVDPSSVGQVIGGCVSQVGMQAMNVTRQAWLTAGLPADIASTTVGARCGSSQQAMTLAYGLVRAGIMDAAVACGLEVMSRVPFGSNVPKDGSLARR
jgi:acetyl-CoA C-acetyltransferase